MGDNATRMAVRLLGNVAQGRGRTLPLDTVRSPLDTHTHPSVRYTCAGIR